MAPGAPKDGSSILVPTWERGNEGGYRRSGSPAGLRASLAPPFAWRPPLRAQHPTPQWRSRAAKGKKVKIQKLLCPGEAEAQAVEAIPRLAPAAIRRTAVPGIEAPAAAPIHAVGARRGPVRVSHGT